METLSSRAFAVLNALPADDPEWQARLAAFHQGLQELGWIVGRNVRIDYRLGTADGAALRRRERRQMASVQKELDQEYEAIVGLNVKPSKDEIQVRKSSSSRT